MAQIRSSEQAVGKEVALDSRTYWPDSLQPGSSCERSRKSGEADRRHCRDHAQPAIRPAQDHGEPYKGNADEAERCLRYGPA